MGKHYPNYINSNASPTVAPEHCLNPMDKMVYESPERLKYTRADCHKCSSSMSVVPYAAMRGRAILRGKKFCMNCGDVNKVVT